MKIVLLHLIDLQLVACFCDSCVDTGIFDAILAQTNNLLNLKNY